MHAFAVLTRALSMPALATDQGPTPGTAASARPFISKPFNNKEKPKMADRETIIETGGGSSVALIAGIIFAVVLVLGFLWFINNNGGGSRTVDVDVPAVTVDVKPDGQ